MTANSGSVLKLVFCCRRRAELTTEQFQTYWRNSHADLVRSVRAAIPTMTRYVQNHTVFGTLTVGVRDSRGAGEPYDGVAEIWIDFDATADVCDHVSWPRFGWLSSRPA
jgi:hypothetical protein